MRRFREQRQYDPEPLGQHISETQPRTLYKLRHGERLRGATWYNRFVGVVFLVAWGEHTSGAADDFYQMLIERLGDIYPDEVDYAALEIWRAERWIRDLQANYAGGLVFDAQNRRIGTEPVPCSVELEACTLILVAYPVDGDFIYLVRVDQPETGPYLTLETAAMAAQILAQQVGRLAQQTWNWNGVQLPPGSYAFDF